MVVIGVRVGVAVLHIDDHGRLAELVKLHQRGQGELQGPVEVGLVDGVALGAATRERHVGKREG